MVVVVVATAGAAFEQLRRGYHYLGGAEALRRGGESPLVGGLGGSGASRRGEAPRRGVGFVGVTGYARRGRHAVDALQGTQEHSPQRREPLYYRGYSTVI